MDEKDLPVGVGPHEGRELELLLTGEKPVARFRLDGLSEEYEARFREAVERMGSSGETTVGSKSQSARRARAARGVSSFHMQALRSHSAAAVTLANSR